MPLLRDWSHWVAKKIRPFIGVDCSTCGAKAGRPCINPEYFAQDKRNDDGSSKLKREPRLHYKNYVHAARRPGMRATTRKIPPRALKNARYYESGSTHLE